MNSSGQSSPVRGLYGTAAIPGDKSISHRALMFGALAAGKTVVTGLLESEDVHSTANALRALGADIVQDGKVWRIRGGKPFRAPAQPLDMGNSGTSTRLLMGIVAGYPIRATFVGDASLSKRPMKRVIDPLTQMGATFEGATLPVTLTGGSLKAIEYTLPVASAQVKSAILLAALRAQGTTVVIEPETTRDHTERMLRLFGADVQVSGKRIAIKGGQTLTAHNIDVPADPSTAAFPAVAALITPGSDITIPNVMMNPSRTGLYTTLIEMGADITFENRREASGEEVADIRVRSSVLTGITVPPARAPSMIDEFPILSIAAAFAQGETVMTNLAELRVKESDRLAAVHAGLTANGVTAVMGDDSLRVTGCGVPLQKERSAVPGGGLVETHLDHRIAMSFLVMGMAAQQPVRVDSTAMISTSFPGFSALMNRLGADIH